MFDQQPLTLFFCPSQYNPTEKIPTFDTWGMVGIKKYNRMRVPKRYSLGLDK